MIDIVTPMNIGDYKLQQILPMLEDSEIGSAKKRLNLVRIIYEVLGYNLSPDVALAAAAECKRQLVIATAGGGKTTWAMVKAIIQKVLRESETHPGNKVSGDDILCLVYNKHNAPDVEAKQYNMVQRWNPVVSKEMKVDDHIYARTMHKFASYWATQYTINMNLVGYTPLEEDDSIKMMERAIKIAYKKLGLANPEKVNAKNVKGFYDYYKETMKTLEELDGCDKMVDLQVPIEELEVFFERYEASKNLSKKYDYIDLLTRFDTMLHEYPDVKKKIQRYYEYVIADEVQDFTPLMWDILELLVDDGTPLVCVGDDDQEIYHFRGANVQLMLDFQERFPDGKAYMLNVNRRCAERILEEAKKVIAKNTLRFDKSLLGTKPGGSVTYLPYKTLEGQMNNLVRRLQTLPEEQWYDTVVCYRETSSSVLLAELLAERNIPFYVISGFAPYTYELYRHVFDVLNILYTPRGKENLVNLYKVLPLQRSDMKAILDSPGAQGKHFKELDYGKFTAFRNFTEVIERLDILSDRIDTEPLETIFPEVFSLICKYFWEFKKSGAKDEKLVEIMEERVKRFFTTRLTYENLLIKHQEMQSKIQNNSEMRNGIALSTFHGVKGLEFHNVYAIDLKDDVFPNFDIIESKPYTAEDKLVLKEAERRLWYVVITRAKLNLTVFYDETDPSLFVKEALGMSLEKVKPTEETDSAPKATDALGVKISSVAKSVRSFDAALKEMTASLDEPASDDFDDFGDDLLDDLLVPADDLEPVDSKLLQPADTSGVKAIVPVTVGTAVSKDDISQKINPTILRSEVSVQQEISSQQKIEEIKQEAKSNVMGNYVNNLLSRF